MAGEIIEHVDNPGMFLKSLTEIMNEDTELILTTPNAYFFRGIISVLARMEKVNPDHNYYFSYRTLQHLLDKFGLKCREVYYYQDQGGRWLWRILDKFISLMVWVSPVWSDGLIVRANLNASEPKPSSVSRGCATQQLTTR